MKCKKCNHKMNRSELFEDGAVVKIKYSCGNLDCKNIEEIERKNYEKTL
jgi:hypothetical protein